MKISGLMAAAGAAFVMTAAVSAQAAITVSAQADVYNIGPTQYEGGPAVAIDVTGLSSITFAVTGSVTLNNGTYTDADGVGAATSDSANSGGNAIAGLTAPNAGFLTGAFVGAVLGVTPQGLDFIASGTSFSTLSPDLQQAFFIGDGLTGDGTGAVQTFYVPTGATTLYLGISDACGYHGSPSCYGDNNGSFSVTTSETASVAGVPEPSTWMLGIVGLGLVGATLRRRRGGDKAIFAA